MSNDNEQSAVALAARDAAPKTPTDALRIAMTCAAVSNTAHLMALCEVLGLDFGRVQARAAELAALATPALLVAAGRDSLRLDDED